MHFLYQKTQLEYYAYVILFSLITTVWLSFVLWFTIKNVLAKGLDIHEFIFPVFFILFGSIFLMPKMFSRFFYFTILFGIIHLALNWGNKKISLQNLIIATGVLATVLTSLTDSLTEYYYLFTLCVAFFCVVAMIFVFINMLETFIEEYVKPTNKKANQTTIYFIRHAESDTTVHDDQTRPLTAKGLADRALATNFLADKKIDAVLSSPYKRTLDTVAHFAESAQLQIQTIKDFRERKISNKWLLGDFNKYTEKQWADFSYKLPHGESIAEVQTRNIAAITDVLATHRGKNLVIGAHGTALSTIINYYDNTFTPIMERMPMPWLVIMKFDGDKCTSIEKIDLFKSK